MSGIVGIVANRPGTAVDPSDFAGLVRAHDDVHGAQEHAVLDAGSRAMIGAFGGSRPARVRRRDEDWSVHVGTVYGLDGARTLVPDDLDGQFLLVAGDSDGDVTVYSDPLGMFPAFAARRADVTYISTSLLALARHLRAEPNRTGIEAFLLTGSQWGRPTLWEGLERLDPATRMEFGADGRHETQYWLPAVDPELLGMPMPQAVDRCIDVALGVLGDRLSAAGQCWIDLTGGFDSRLLALLLTRVGVAFEGNTVGKADDPDAVIAARLAREAGWPWRRFELPDSWSDEAPTLVDEALAAGNGHLDALQLAEVLWANRTKAAVRPRLLSGGGGETYRSYAWAQEFWRAGRSTHVNMDNWIDMRILGAVDRGLFARDPLSSVRADFAARMRQRAAAYTHLPNTTQLEIMYAYKVTGHFGAYAAASAHLLDVELPYYWREIYSSAFSVRPVHRNWNRFQRAMITRLDRRLAALPTERGGPAEAWRPWNLHRFGPYFMRQFRGVVPKVSERLIGRRLMAEHRSLADRAAAGRRAALQRLDLNPGSMRSRKLYDAAALAGLLDDARDPQFDRWPILGRIATVETALQAAGATLDD